MSNKELLMQLIDEINTEKQDIIGNVPDGDFLRGQVNFAQIVLNMLKKKLHEQTDDWTPVSERKPNQEEYNKNDGRFIADDGNRRYPVLYNIYEKRFIDIASGNINDTNVIAWHELPDKYNPPKEYSSQEWYPNADLPPHGMLCICINKFGSHMPFMAQFREPDTAYDKPYMLQLDNFNETEDCRPEVILMPAIEKWKPAGFDALTEETIRTDIENTLPFTLPAITKGGQDN